MCESAYPMQSIVCLLTSLLFAAHALLGCGAHRACEHGTAIWAGSATAHAEHECVAHHDGHDGAPSDKDHDSSEPCSHSVCSFVKAETQRVDKSNDVVTSWVLSAPVELGQGDAASLAVFEPVCRTDLSSTQLYVWHCALII
jgi:hypothetical protein